MNSSSVELEDEGLDDLPGVPPEFSHQQINDPLTWSEEHGSAESAEGSADGSSSAGKTPTSNPNLRRALLEGYEEAAAGAFYAVGGMLNTATALDEDDDIWLPTNQEAQAVAQPLARLADRHIPTPGGNADPGDVADAIALGVGLVVYAVRNLTHAFKRRADRRRLAQAVQPSEDA